MFNYNEKKTRRCEVIRILLFLSISFSCSGFTHCTLLQEKSGFETQQIDVKRKFFWFLEVQTTVKSYKVETVSWGKRFVHWQMGQALVWFPSSKKYLTVFELQKDISKSFLSKKPISFPSLIKIKAP